MPTTNERIYITLTPSMAKELAARARREKAPRATIARQLLEDALFELTDEEDRYLSALADRQFEETTTWLSHEEFWKRVETLREKKK